ncbi:hypothetical protein DL96DRAFT_1685535 [Flagelloscypha sp. PMI_526]|nr:hypothetical protein DL96DRAFT_1685535 [Flagelloscypha sp. PMI_526]
MHLLCSARKVVLRELNSVAVVDYEKPQLFSKSSIHPRRRTEGFHNALWRGIMEVDQADRVPGYWASRGSSGMVQKSKLLTRRAFVMSSAYMLPELPREVIFSILEYVLRENPSKAANVPLLSISKSIHNWMLPQLYHSLQFGTREGSLNDVDRKKLLATADPASLLFIRRLNTGYYHTLDKANTFAPFSKLTHLSMWGPQGLRHPEAQAIPSLALEELIIWTQTERSEFLKAFSAECTLARTLRRFGSFENWPEEDFQCLKVGKNLSHILVYSGIRPFLRFSVKQVKYFLNRDHFLCFLVVPGLGTTNPHTFTTNQETFKPLNDYRVVLVKNIKENFGLTCSAPHFWEAQSTLWGAAEAVVAGQPSLTTITVLDHLP